MNEALDRVKSVYRIWGRNPGLYHLGATSNFLFRDRFVRGRAVGALRLRPGGLALEVACGTGLNIPFLRAAVGETGKVVGFDYTTEMLAAAGALVRGKGWRNIELVQGDAAELRVPQDGFDGALVVLGMSVIPDRTSAIRRIHDLLREGGRLSACDAHSFRGPLRFLNPIVEPIFRWTARWNPEADIPAEIEAVFGNIEVEYLHGGTLFIATAEKE